MIVESTFFGLCINISSFNFYLWPNNYIMHTLMASVWNCQVINAWQYSIQRCSNFIQRSILWMYHISLYKIKAVIYYNLLMKQLKSAYRCCCWHTQVLCLVKTPTGCFEVAPPYLHLGAVLNTRKHDIAVHMVYSVPCLRQYKIELLKITVIWGREVQKCCI